ncbi:MULTISPECIES: MFS transporter [unclassified Spirosoma]|uniref:MFS transporter n=1 Tax=unclassified Spirosoma TaxID=2621999 RepID=UPI000A5005C4|nr:MULTISPECIES: MFS transporter [unclassified Spirosoma]MBN8822114.1 MFS transporter [Spirosoma sp.]
MSPTTRVKLSVMMFLQFFVWGAWYGQMSKYLLTELHASGDQVGNAYAAFSLAMIIAPFFVGMIADRYFAAQKVLGVLNLLGAVVLYFITQNTDPGQFFYLILAYCLTFAPTLALTSSIAFTHLDNDGSYKWLKIVGSLLLIVGGVALVYFKFISDQFSNNPVATWLPLGIILAGGLFIVFSPVSNNKDAFPFIRVSGTVAWIVVTNIVGFLGFGDKVTIFQLSMYSAVVLGVLAFFLPDTPPKATTSTSFSQILGLDAFKLFKDRSFAIFFLSSVLICIPLSFYYAMANPSLTDGGMQNVENKMSLGQASEVIFMLLIPLAFSRLGVKKMLIVGLVAWIVRFICFGYGDVSSEWMLYIAIVLHGVCYDFFFVTGQIYTDNKAGEKIKSSAQGLISIATYGIGMGIGSKISGIVLDMYTRPDGTKDWLNVWLVPAGIAAVVLILFVLLFTDTQKTQAKEGELVAGNL